ncbi:MAG: hypothetical protein JXR53_03875 [Bacteroidales bacterium]|nr:hypothetical protein [Bacteroidales bacterium]
MRRKITMLKTAIIIAGLFAISLTTTAQIKIKPAILDIGSAYDKEFVLVIKANEKFEVPERAVLSNFRADTVPFDPNKMDTYAKWRFSNFTLYSHDGTATRYISLYCITTQKYLRYRSGHSAEMINQEEYDKIMEKDEKNEWVNSTEDIMQLFFKPLIEDEYIQLGIYNKEGKSLVVTQMDWNTRFFKIVLCNY